MLLISVDEDYDKITFSEPQNYLNILENFLHKCSESTYNWLNFKESSSCLAPDNFGGKKNTPIKPLCLYKTNNLLSYIPPTIIWLICLCTFLLMLRCQKGKIQRTHIFPVHFTMQAWISVA